MNHDPLIFVAVGLAALLAALLPFVLRHLPVSLPMIFLGLGWLVFTFADALPSPDPIEHGVATLHLTEVCVIISLFGAGVAIDRPIGWHRWRSTWRLLAITMPLTVAAGAVLGWWLLGLAPAAALLLSALLSPTDPVLATEVQVGEPSDEKDSEDEPRFALTSEAGLNDFLAFPFTLAAIAMAAEGASPSNWFGGWVLEDVLLRVSVGLIGGLVTGRLLSRLFFSHPRPGRKSLSERAQGFEALACTFIAYGVTELAHGYGFLAVFVCACTIRNFERDHGSHQVIHQFVEQIERLITVAVLILLGGAVARGLLNPLQWQDFVFAAVLLLVFRPLLGILGLTGAGIGARDRWVIGFFGVRGVGSLFYLAYALQHAEFAGAERLWAVTGLVVVMSVVLHGVSATPVMYLLDRRRSAVAAQQGEKETRVTI